ncbi:MAG: hypothetical protein R3Y56_06035 [Akkermansia sp.]
MHPIIKYALIVYPLFVYLTSLIADMINEKSLSIIDSFVAIGFAYIFYVPILLPLTLVFYPLYQYFNKNLFVFLIPPLCLGLLQNNPAVAFSEMNAPFFRFRVENLLHWIPMLLSYIWIVYDEIKKRNSRASLMMDS